MPSPVMSEVDTSNLLSLLRSAPFSAPYLGETIDWIRRSVRQEVDRARSPLDVEAEALRRVEAYAAGRGLGAAELGRRLADARHALEAVRHDHYLRLTVGQGAGGGTAQVSRRAELLKLATAVGSARVAVGPTGAVVITSVGSGSTVFRPVSPEVAHRMRGVARGRKEATVRRSAAVRELLAQHVRMADWSDPWTVGVVVDGSARRWSCRGGNRTRRAARACGSKEGCDSCVRRSLPSAATQWSWRATAPSTSPSTADYLSL